MSVIRYLLLISLLKVLHSLHQILNSHSLGMSLDLTKAFIHCAMSPWKHVWEFLAIIKLMSSATIFTSTHIAILLLSLHVFFLLTRTHIATLLLLLLFSGTPYYWFPYCINFYTWSVQEIFVAKLLHWFFKLRIFQWYSLSMISI